MHIVKINIGSGPDGLNSWINLDSGLMPLFSKFPRFKNILFRFKLLPDSYNVSWPKSLKLFDCRKDLPFDNDSVDFIYTSHFLEHIELYEVYDLLRSVNRKLKPGGIVRIVLPDVDSIVTQYYSSMKSNKLEIINDHFYGSIAPSKHRPSFINLAKRYFIRGHKWMYTFDYFSEIMIECGFNKENIFRRKFCEGLCPDIGELDKHQDHSFYMEAIKS